MMMMMMILMVAVMMAVMGMRVMRVLILTMMLNVAHVADVQGTLRRAFAWAAAAFLSYYGIRCRRSSCPRGHDARPRPAPRTSNVGEAQKSKALAERRRPAMSVELEQLPPKAPKDMCLCYINGHYVPLTRLRPVFAHALS